MQSESPERVQTGIICLYSACCLLEAALLRAALQRLAPGFLWRIIIHSVLYSLQAHALLLYIYKPGKFLLPVVIFTNVEKVSGRRLDVVLGSERGVSYLLYHVVLISNARIFLVA